jgi:hypothetical protein
MRITLHIFEKIKIILEYLYRQELIFNFDHLLQSQNIHVVIILSEILYCKLCLMHEGLAGKLKPSWD